MARAKTKPASNPGEGPAPNPPAIMDESPPTKVKFIRLWSSDRGVFQAGTEAELPAGIAASLVLERVAEEV